MGNYLKDSIKTYVESFKNKNILIVAALNVLFFLTTAIIVEIVKAISKQQMIKVNSLDISNLTLQSESQLQAIAGTLKGFAIFAVLTALLFVVLLIINWSFFQGMIYHILSKRKFSLKYFEKFLLLNLIWFIPWIAIFFIILFGVKAGYLVAAFYFLIGLFLHSSFVLYTLFVKGRKLKKMVHLKISIVKIYHFIIPYTLITITFMIISQLNLLNPHYTIIIGVYLLFFSWLQSYTKDIIIKIHKV